MPDLLVMSPTATTCTSTPSASPLSSNENSPKSQSDNNSTGSNQANKTKAISFAGNCTYIMKL